jgi:hypothetical protein
MGDSISAYHDRLEEEARKERKKELKALLNHWLDNIGEFDNVIKKVGDGIEYVDEHAIGDRNLHSRISELSDSFQTLTTLPEKKLEKSETKISPGYIKSV